jgi:ABC-type antimicrobial peptide transport system permease subunit
MAIGISGMIEVFILYDYEAKFDNFLKNTSNIYRINAHRLVEGREQPWGITPMAFCPELTVANENISTFCRYGTSRVLIKNEDIIHSEEMYFADSNFFDLFKFKTLHGDAESFHRKNTAIVSREFAQKYFGSGEAQGKQISLIKDDKVALELVIGAILEEIPKNSSFHFDIIIPYDNAYDLYRIDRSAWSMDLSTITYIQLSTSVDPSQIASLLKNYVTKNNETLDNWQVKDYYLMPFRNQKKESHKLYSAITWPGLPISALYGSLFLDTVILLISCFNFTNTAMAYARKRLKEIGIRKTFGAVKRQIIIQYMFENLMQCFAGLLIAVYLTDVWISWMNIQWPIDIKADYAGDPLLIGFMIVIVFAATLIGGAYPSFYVARYQPATILKGDLRFSGTNIFTRVLLTIQFGFSVMAVFCAVVLYLNARYQLSLDWGYNKKSVIVIPMHNEGSLEVYKNASAIIPGVMEIAGTIHNAGYEYDNILTDINGEPHQSQIMLTGDRYIHTMGIEIIEGRDFIPQSDNDRNESIIVNRKFLETFGIKHPLSQLIRMEGHAYYIIGVVKDFMPYGLMSPVNPVIIRSVPDLKCTQLCIHAEPARLKEVFESLHKKWNELFPMKPFDGYYQEEAAGYAMHTNQGILTMFIFMGLFALILSTIGLYSMVSLNVTKRTKEIGIRKVLGASTIQIIRLMNREFVIILSIACLYGCVTGYYFMNKFLGDIFTYYLDIGSGACILSVSLILLTAFITSGRKIYIAAQTDPARSLRYE